MPGDKSEFEFKGIIGIISDFQIEIFYNYEPRFIICLKYFKFSQYMVSTLRSLQ